jgi:predicted Zn finger-like uncharacterized protein
MSLITRCPACQTLFKVVPDQLRISEGWVRCGQCDDIFDASQHLVQSLVPVSAAAAAQDAPPFQGDEPALADIVITSTPETEMWTGGAMPGGGLPSVEASAVLVSEEQPLSLPQPHVETSEPQESPESPEPRVLDQAAPSSSEASHDPDFESQPDSRDISFLREARPPATNQSLLMRATWSLLSAALLLGLAGQIVLHERDHIAALRPDLRPWLQAVCDRLNCSVSPWRKIESIVIDSSAFTRVNGDSYRLSLTLKNVEAVPVALPALELTLTDTLDQPVIRRVLILSEIDGEPESIAAGSERPVSLTMSVNPQGGSDRFAGYRILAFYP